MKHGGSRKRRVSIAIPIRSFVVVCAVFGATGMLLLSLRPVDPPSVPASTTERSVSDSGDLMAGTSRTRSPVPSQKVRRPCATVEEMGEEFGRGLGFWKESLRVRRVIDQHFGLNGTHFRFMCVNLLFACFYIIFQNQRLSFVWNVHYLVFLSLNFNN